MIPRLFFLFLLLSVSPLRAALVMPAFFGDHMVLQSGMNVPVWGWSDAASVVVVEIADQKKETRADDAGRWKVVLGAMQAGDVPVTMTVSSSGGRKVIRDILIGEVWLGSGQSNMAMTVSRAMNFEKEKTAAHLPSIRCFTTVMQNAATPQETCQGQWKVCSAETVGAFSATGYFFAREVHHRLRTPVGLVISAVGGTPIDAWVAGAKQRARPELKPLFSSGADFDVAKAKAEYEAAKETWKSEVKKARAEGKAPPRPPRDPVTTRERKANVGGLFNGMINPLVPMALRGVLWYQGEANTFPEKARLYQHQLPLLVNDWRERWDCELPVAWVQLPNFSGNGRDLPSVREAMSKTLRLPRTGMAVTIDIGETKDIHPKNKQEVGRRLSLWALHEVYGKKEVAFRGPNFSGMEIRDSTVIITLSDAKELRLKNDSLAISGFQIAGADQVWRPAQARLESGKITATSSEVNAPVAIRYAWENDPQVNLVNEAGLPLAPFRTDTW